MSTQVLQRHPAQPPAGPAAQGSGAPHPLASRWWPAVAETALALGVAALFTVWAVTVHDNPISRTGQVSGLAALQFRLALCALPLLAVTAWATLRASGPVRRLALRLGPAAAAGLFGGFLGGGQMFALRGTPWGLAGQLADNGRLIEWTQEVLQKGTFDNIYPPGIPHLAAFIARHFEHGDAAMAFKPLFIAMLAFTPGLVYLGWRMVLRPLPALAVAVLSTLSQFLPYKPYDTLTLLVFVPVVAKLAQWLRGSPGLPAKGAFGRGVWLGVMLGTIFVVYSGWHVWSLPGTALLVLVLFPWRRAGRTGRLRAAALLGGTLLGFLPVGGVYLHEMLGATGIKDTYCSFVTQTDPAYIGQTALSSHTYEVPGSYPGPGEIAGLGLFALFTVAGLGAAVALGLRRPPVAAAVACFGSSWLLRFYLAHNMERDGAVQLYPRTTMEIQYTLIVLAVLACVLGAERIQALAATVARLAGTRGIGASPLPPAPLGATGALLALILVGGMGGSWLTDRYLAAPPGRSTAGTLAWTAQHLQTPEGRCPAFADGACAEPVELRPTPSRTTATLNCPAIYRAYTTAAAATR